MLPDSIFAKLNEPVAVRAPPTIISFASTNPINLDFPLTCREISSDPIGPSSRLNLGTEVPIPTLFRFEL